MAKKKTVQTEPYTLVPAVDDVPPVFEAAAALNLEAQHAIQYWKEQHKTALFSDRQYFAKEKLRAWTAVSEKAQAVMQSYQLKLF